MSQATVRYAGSVTEGDLTSNYPKPCAVMPMAVRPDARIFRHETFTVPSSCKHTRSILSQT